MGYAFYDIFTWRIVMPGMHGKTRVKRLTRCVALGNFNEGGVLACNGVRFLRAFITWFVTREMQWW
jgi:hypothetical protein